ncbi:DUF6318 family protein [uncultured Rothia sp.]|uniref:DUF6318 family protein n=1 Tax=uncultured Rothia sp. TaxID=316088 RepID=UPI0025E2411C|nr:DUF6318 family protein [uncultured Rothia sp.]
MALFPMTSGLPSSTTGISRRSALRYAGAGVAGMSLSALLVACGGSSSSAEDADVDTPQISPSASARADFSGEVTFDNYEKKGNFVPATESAPAQNVPLPKRPASASENSVQGLYDSIAFVYAAINYLVLTGDAAPLRESKADDKFIASFSSFMDESNESSQNRDWFVSPKVTMSAFTAVPALVKKSVQWTFDLVIDLGPTVVIDGAPAEMSEKVRRTERGLVVTGVRHDNDWTLTIQDEYEVQASAQPKNGGANGGASGGANGDTSGGNSGNGGNSNGDNL